MAVTDQGVPAGPADAAAGQPARPGVSAQSGPPGYPPGWTPQPVYTSALERRLGGIATAIWTKPSWLAPLAILACVGMVSGYVIAFNPTDGQTDPQGGCAFKAVTGLDCPGCGGTRALWYLLHANLPQAARHHAVAVFAVPFVVYAYLAWAGQRVLGWRLPVPQLTGRMLGIFLAAWGVFTVVRNLPWAPFDWLYV